MSLSRETLQSTLLTWMSAEDNPWTIWYGADKATATQLLNKDGSNVYTRQENVSPEIMAYDDSIKITTEVYRVTWVQENVSDEPDANTGWWLSHDRGITKQKVIFLHKKSKAKRSRWHILLKNG
ncbi:MAG: hypothetical protein ACRC1Z_18250 [Waterburya sp.]